MLRKVLAASAAFTLAACGGVQVAPKDYSTFAAEAPRSILVVPVVNHTNEVEAANLFLTTLAVPLAERGFYTFPTNATRRLMEAEGLGDAGLVHETPTSTLANIFGADAVLYVEILKWESDYNIVNSAVKTEMLYTLKSGKSDVVLWQDQQEYEHRTSANTGNFLANLIANAVTAALDSTRSDYTPVAMSANVFVMTPQGNGLPFGPYSTAYGENAKLFPATGTGKISDAQQEAISAPGITGPDEGEVSDD